MAHLSRTAIALIVFAWPVQAVAASTEPASVHGVAAADTAAANEAPARTANREPRDDGPPLLFERGTPIGAYGGLDVAYSRMFGQDGAVVGVQGALIVNHRLSLGLAGYGWTNSQSGPTDGLGRPQKFETGYGGATVRYSFFLPELPVYLTVGALIGGGAIVLGPADRGDFDDSNESEDVFTLVQPDLTLHANLTHWMRVGVTAGYRVTSGVDRMGFEESDVNGLVLGGQLQFGRF